MSGNELSELLTMTARIEDTINSDFLHVADHVPAAFTHSLDKFRAELIKEQERREDEF